MKINFLAGILIATSVFSCSETPELCSLNPEVEGGTVCEDILGTDEGITDGSFEDASDVSGDSPDSGSDTGADATEEVGDAGLEVDEFETGEVFDDTIEDDGVVERKCSNENLNWFFSDCEGEPIVPSLDCRGCSLEMRSYCIEAPDVLPAECPSETEWRLIINSSVQDERGQYYADLVIPITLPVESGQLLIEFRTNPYYGDSEGAQHEGSIQVLASDPSNSNPPSAPFDLLTNEESVKFYNSGSNISTLFRVDTEYSGWNLVIRFTSSPGTGSGSIVSLDNLEITLIP